MHELKRRLETLADEGKPAGAAEVMRRARRSLEDPSQVPGFSRDRTRSRSLVALAGVAMVLVVAVGAVLVLQASDDGGRVIAGGHPRRSNEPLFLAPTVVPDGFRLLQVAGGDRPDFVAGQGGSYEWDRVQRWVKFDAAHQRPVGVLDVSWGPGTTAPSVPGGRPPSTDPLAGFRLQSVPVKVRNRPGLYSGQLRALVWEEPQGRAVLVSGPFTVHELQGIADGLAPRHDGGFVLRNPPQGFELVAEEPGYGSEGMNPRVMIYQGDNGRGFELHVVDHSQMAPGMNLWFTDARLVRVRGQDAVLAPRLFSQPGGFDQQTLFMRDANLFVQWREPGNVTVTISGVRLSEGEILSVARNLEVLDRQQWNRLKLQAPGRY